MNGKLIILSDIHGNLSALNAVIADFEDKGYNPDAIAILGDNINYGMRPNEVISKLRSVGKRFNIIVNIFGNHEKALLDGDTTHFSTERGKQILGVTRSMIYEGSLEYLKQLTSKGLTEHEINGKKILFIHGNISDPYWGKLNAVTAGDERYAEYDYVISGHSHVPHLIEQFYDSDRPEFRNKKRTVFLNPGSVGQPRNHNPKAQYLYVDIDTETFHFNSVPYDIETDRSLFEQKEIDKFYSERLIRGI